MSQEKTYKGQCFCGAVTVEVTGDPEGAGYCHCASCRSWSAGPLLVLESFPTAGSGRSKIISRYLAGIARPGSGGGV